MVTSRGVEDLFFRRKELRIDAELEGLYERVKPAFTIQLPTQIHWIVVWLMTKIPGLVHGLT
jgi:hypothetical protein